MKLSPSTKSLEATFSLGQIGDKKGASSPAFAPRGFFGVILREEIEYPPRF